MPTEVDQPFPIGTVVRIRRDADVKDAGDSDFARKHLGLLCRVQSYDDNMAHLEPLEPRPNQLTVQGEVMETGFTPFFWGTSDLELVRYPIPPDRQPETVEAWLNEPEP